MKKARTAAQKRRGRPRKEGERGATGRLRPQRKGRADMTGLLTRAMHAGLIEMRPTPTARAIEIGMRDAAAVLDAVKSPWYGDNAGLAIAAEPDAPSLWQVISNYRAARSGFQRAIAAPRAVGQRLGDKPPPDQEPPPPVDLRDEAEAYRAALAAWVAITDTIRARDPLIERYLDLTLVQDITVAGDLPGLLRWLKGAMGW